MLAELLFSALGLALHWYITCEYANGATSTLNKFSWSPCLKTRRITCFKMLESLI